MSDFTIAKGYRPGAIGRIAELHGAYYHDHWGFGLFFEAKVATGLSEFLERYDETRDGFWLALRKDRIEGAIAIEGQRAEERGARLRWFILSDALRGQGAGAALLRAAMDFCRAKGYPTITLSTFKGLVAARHLYEKAGFRLVHECMGTQWGNEVCEQRFECRLPADAKR